MMGKAPSASIATKRGMKDRPGSLKTSQSFHSESSMGPNTAVRTDLQVSCPTKCATLRGASLCPLDAWTGSRTCPYKVYFREGNLGVASVTLYTC
jgi:hypothetical protein